MPTTFDDYESAAFYTNEFGGFIVRNKREYIVCGDSIEAEIIIAYLAKAERADVREYIDTVQDFNLGVSMFQAYHGAKAAMVRLHELMREPATWYGA